MVRRLAAGFAGFLVAVSVIGCGPVPRPFQPEQKASPETISAQLGARAGVAVRPVAGLESTLSAALRAQIVAALQEREVPAVTEGANRASYSLAGRFTDSERRMVAWRLTDAAGAERLVFETAVPQGVDDPTIGADVARRVAAVLLPPTENAAPMARVVVPLVDGAPGDGRQALAAAMRQSLASAGLAVSETIVDDAFLVLGSVFASPVGENEQTIEITWTLMRPDGSRIGSVDQRNTVPVGALNGRWGPVARLIADFGAGGIVTMLDKLGASQ